MLEMISPYVCATGEVQRPVSKEGFYLAGLIHNYRAKLRYKNIASKESAALTGLSAKRH